MQLISNPCVPTSLAISEPLVNGSLITVQGHVCGSKNIFNFGKKNGDFCVELLSGSIIALHVNFRFNCEHIVAMNSNLNGSWGTEIRHHNPLHKNDHFELNITVYQSHFHICVNGQHLADYPHRYPFSSIQAIGLKGDVHVDNVKFEGTCPTSHHAPSVPIHRDFVSANALYPQPNIVLKSQPSYNLIGAQTSIGSPAHQLCTLSHKPGHISKTTETTYKVSYSSSYTSGNSTLSSIQNLRSIHNY